MNDDEVWSILDESLNWLKIHPNAKNHDVPRHLLDHWCVEDENDDRGISFLVFLYGYFQSRFFEKTGHVLELDAHELNESFQRWHLKLSLARLHLASPAKSAPLPLFYFPKEENVRCWLS